MTNTLMEAICSPDNVEAAVRAVVRNKGAPGVDGMTVRELPDVLVARWPEIERTLLEGRYQPQPVRRVMIPKPGGGERALGIPCTLPLARRVTTSRRAARKAVSLMHPFGRRTCTVDTAPLFQAPLFTPNGIQGRGLPLIPCTRWPDAETCRVQPR